jgi:trk system potassium uptake protein
MYPIRLINASELFIYFEVSMNFLVVGCGRLGAELAYCMSLKGHEITVIDNHVDAFQNLHQDFRGRTVIGEATDEYVLRRAKIEEADGVAVVTNSDSLNIVVAHIAHTVFQIPTVIARNYDPSRRSLYETFNLQVVSSTSWGAHRIEELLYHHELRPVVSAGHGEVEIFEFTIPSTWNGRLLGELIPVGCQPVALTRTGQAILANEKSELRQEDVLLIGATISGIEELRSRLGQEKGV